MSDTMSDKNKMTPKELRDEAADAKAADQAAKDRAADQSAKEQSARAKKDEPPTPQAWAPNTKFEDKRADVHQSMADDHPDVTPAPVGAFGPAPAAPAPQAFYQVPPPAQAMQAPMMHAQAAPKGGLRQFKVLVRHSQVPIKRAIVAATDETDAFNKFCDMNRTKAQTLFSELGRRVRGKEHPAPQQVEKFIQERHLYGIEITPVDPNAPGVAPLAPAAPAEHAPAHGTQHAPPHGQAHAPTTHGQHGTGTHSR